MTLLSATLSFAHACGEVVTIPTHGNTTTRYAFASPPDAKGTLVLLAGGGGHLDLDDKGCPRALTGNSLARSMPHFHALGFATALVDAPSDYPGDDGLGGFRIAADHADDLGIVIADVRVRAKVPVWLIGTSRGSISAANAAARLSGPAAADGVVLTSALMYGNRGQKLWVTQTLFDVTLESILPVLVIGHAEDKCLRSPPDQMDRITARTNGSCEQVAGVGCARRTRYKAERCAVRTLPRSRHLPPQPLANPAPHHPFFIFGLEPRRIVQPHINLAPIRRRRA